MNPLNAFTKGARKLRDYNDKRTIELAREEADRRAEKAYAGRANKFKLIGKDTNGNEWYRHPKTGQPVTVQQMAADAVRTREYIRGEVLKEKLGPTVARKLERTIRHTNKGMSL